MRRPVVPVLGRGPWCRRLLSLGAALMLLGHLLGPHAGAHASPFALATGQPPAPGEQHVDADGGQPQYPEHREPSEYPEHRESVGDPPCGYLCLRGDDHGTVGAHTGWRDDPAPRPVAATSRARRGGHGPRAPPDPVRELQVIRV